MFCSKCGKEIADEALICPQCGCATANYNQPFATQNAQPENNSIYSQDYVVLKEFEEKVNSLYAISIIAAVLFLGIGIIFSFAVWAKAKTISIPSITTTNPNEIAMFESLKRKLKKALTFAYMPWYVLIIILSALFFSGMIGAGLLAFIVWIAISLISMPCTKHLNAELYGTKK